METFQNYLDVAIGCAQEAGEVVRKAFFNESKKVEFKGEVDLVTETDRLSESIIKNKIKQHYPTHTFIGEEGAAAGEYSEVLTDNPSWMVDPIDGTTNFVHRYPVISISIALAINKKVVAAVVYNPILNEMFTATRGGGAYLNGKPIKVSETAVMKNALVCIGFPIDRSEATLDLHFGRLHKILKACRDLRRDGSAALDCCSVAMGRLDVYLEFGIHSWDIAAGTLIVEEAGGAVSSADGTPFDVSGRQVLVLNHALLPQMLALLKKD